MPQQARLSHLSSPDGRVCTGPVLSPLQEHRITAHEQLFQDATRRRMRAEEYAQWFPEDVTFHPRLTESSKTWDSEKLRAELQVAVADRWVTGFQKAGTTSFKCRLQQGRPAGELLASCDR